MLFLHGHLFKLHENGEKLEKKATKIFGSERVKGEFVKSLSELFLEYLLISPHSKLLNRTEHERNSIPNSAVTRGSIILPRKDQN